MKIYDKLILITLCIFAILNPLLLSTNKFNIDYLIYLLVIIQFLGFIFFKNERLKVINFFKTIFKNKITLTLLLLNLTMYFSTFVATDKRVAFTHSIRFSMYIILYYTISYSINSKKDLNILINAFLSSSILVSLGSFKEVLSYKMQGIEISRSYRIASTLENSNNLGLFALLSIFLALMMLFNSKNSSKRLFYLIILFLNFFNLVVCQSRNIILGLSLGIFILLVIYNKRFLLLAIIPPLGLLIPQIRNIALNFLSLTPESSRYRIWKTTALMIKDNFLTGIGYENYHILYQSYVDKSKETLVPLEGYGWIAQHPHNLLLKFQAETGILGSIVLILFIIATYLYLFKSISYSKSTFANLILKAIIASFTAFIALNIFDCYFGSPKIMYTLFLILGFASCINHIENHKKYK